jgi:hypothetical protein
VLKLSTTLTIYSAGGPLVLPRKVLPGSNVHHRLNCEDVTNLHKSNGLVLAVMRHLGSAVENAANTVSSVAAHNRETLWLNMVADDVS